MRRTGIGERCQITDLKETGRVSNTVISIQLWIPV